MVGRILSLMPPKADYVHFVEPFAGGLTVLLSADHDGISEVVNDIDHLLSGFWDVLRDESLFPAFRRACEATPFSQSAWETAEALLDSVDPVTRAWAFFVRCRQSMAGRMQEFAPLSKRRTRRRMNEQASAWLGAVDGLPEVHARLKRVVILCDDALSVIKSEDGPLTAFYLDPPYLKSTRTTPSVFRHEVDDDFHARLLDLLVTLEGKVILSAYRSPLYDEKLKGWARHEFEIANHAAHSATKRRMVECCYLNY